MVERTGACQHTTAERAHLSFLTVQRASVPVRGPLGRLLRRPELEERPLRLIALRPIPAKSTSHLMVGELEPDRFAARSVPVLPELPLRNVDVAGELARIRRQHDARGSGQCSSQGHL